MLTDDLIEYALPKTSGRTIADVRAGLGYTCVMLDDSECGLAYTFRGELGCGCGLLAEAGNLIGRSCEELIPWVKSNNRLMAAVGLATINAVLNSSRTNWGKGNVVTAIDVDSSDTFGMVGAFQPILNAIKGKTGDVYVFEQNIADDGSLFPEESIPEHLPKCTAVVITATSIINHTIDGVLAQCGSAKLICVVGPSTPLCPEVFKRRGVTLLAGSVVKDPQFVLRIVSQGGGTMAMKPGVDQVLVRL